MLLTVDGDPAITSIGFDISLSTGQTVARSFPVTTGALPGRVVVELPDVAVVVTIAATGTGPGIEYSDDATVTSKPHQQVEVPLVLGTPSRLDLGTTDEALPDLADADLVGADLSSASLDMPLVTPDLPSVPSLLLLAGQPGGSGSHNATGTVARFGQLEKPVIVGNTLYIGEHFSGRLRTVDLTTGAVGAVTLVRESDGQPADLGNLAGLAYKDGFLYAAMILEHTVRKVELATGKVSLVIGKPTMTGTTDGDVNTALFNGPWGLAFAPDGALWVADSNNDRLRRIDLAGPSVTTPALVEASPTDMGAVPTFQEPHGLEFDGSVLYVADGGGIVRVDTTNGLASIFVARNKLQGCSDILIRDGNIYALDYGLNSVWRFPLASPATGTVVAGGNVFQAESRDGQGAAARFQNSEWIVGGGANEAFVVESFALRRMTLDTFAVTTFAGLGEHAGYRNTPDARLKQPGSLVYDGVDTVYFSEYGNHRIRKYTLSTGAVADVAGNGDPVWADGPAAQASFYTPAGLALDKDGNLYIAEDQVHDIRRLDKSGMVTTFAGHPNTAGVAGVDGQAALDAYFGAPAGLLFDGTSTLFVTELDNSVVRAIDLSTASHPVSVVAGSGVRAHDDNTMGKLARFDRPNGMALDRTANVLYVAETSSETVRRIDLANANHPVSTLSGITYQAFSATLPSGDNGSLAGTRHNGPTELALDASNRYLFVTNRDGHTIQRLDLMAQTSLTIVGAPREDTTLTGPLPGRVHGPSGLVMTPLGLVTTSIDEHSLLLATGVVP